MQVQKAWPSEENKDHEASSGSISNSDSASSSDSDSDSSSGSSSSSDSDASADAAYLRRFHLFSASNEKKTPGLKCSKGNFLKGSKCLPCTLCGPDLYVRQQCQLDRDTVCDWCLNVRALKNDDFQLKCFEVAKIHREFELLARRPSSQVLPERDLTSVVFVEKDPAPYVSYTSIREPFRLASKAAAERNTWKLEMLVELCFYLVLIALIFAVIRYISKSKPYYRTVTVHPPILTEHDSKDIIRAAEHIREKLGKKGYNRLEEFI